MTDIRTPTGEEDYFMENNNEERSLQVRNATMVTSDIFGESKAKRMTSLDLRDEEQVDMFLNAQNDADFKLNDCAGKVLTKIF